MSDQPAAAAAETPESAPAEGVNYDEPTLARTAAVEGAEDGDEATDDEPAESDTTEDAETAETTTEPEKPAKRTMVGDLQAARAKNKELAEQVKQRDDFIRAWQPLLQRLDGRPDLQEALVKGTITIAQAETIKQNDEQAELREIAEDNNWYREDGEPDVKRAEKHVQRISKIASKVAGSAVQPVQQHVASQQAQSRIDQAVAFCEANGHADPAFVRAEFEKAVRNNPQALLSDESANALYYMIIGNAVTQGRAGKAPAKKAAATVPAGDETNIVHTEPANGRRGAGPQLTAYERELGKRFGLTEADWTKGQQRATARRGYVALTDDDD